MLEWSCSFSHWLTFPSTSRPSAWTEAQDLEFTSLIPILFGGEDQGLEGSVWAVSSRGRLRADFPATAFWYPQVLAELRYTQGKKLWQNGVYASRSPMSCCSGALGSRPGHSASFVWHVLNCLHFRMFQLRLHGLKANQYVCWVPVFAAPCCSVSAKSLLVSGSWCFLLPEGRTG
jgi:hypothetical protein